MLAFAKHIGADLKTYDHLENPIQQRILEMCFTFYRNSKRRNKNWQLMVAPPPILLLPVGAMATGVLKLVFPPCDFDDELREACQRIVSAMISYPELIGGTERLDTLIMQAAQRQNHF